MSKLDFDFTVDKSTNSVVVIREFDAAPALVWDAFTKQEVLDQWWAPKPWMSKTKFMDFREGGRRFYAMVSPEGHEGWQIQDYTSISPKPASAISAYLQTRTKIRSPQVPIGICISAKKTEEPK